ncbi:MAG: BlaI/MecI/CopY family transcriptional regulator [Peptococcaceae bacterium]|nr:BlaI/MecI/CopY family transcriptional regulator [Peptococcaceae bacterium]
MEINISAAELEVIRVLWREERPLTFAEIRGGLTDKAEWSRSTVQTLVVRLRDKGMINASSQYMALYTPNVTEQDYVQAEGHTFLNRLFNGNAKSFVSALCRNGELSQDDIDELRGFFDVEETRE